MTGLACILPADMARASTSALTLSGSYAPIHDPDIIRAGSTYYVFGTSQTSTSGQIPIHTSTDMLAWKASGNVFSSLPSWALTAVPSLTLIWAPNISYVNGKYLLYYACSSFGSNTSAIGLATNTTLDSTSSSYAWVDKGLVLSSSSTSNYNAIDPCHIVDLAGNHWLSFGSFWSGIKLVKLDSSTNKPPSGTLKLYSIARRPSSTAVEAPYIIQRSGYYYLFASFDYCCSGSSSTYYTVVGRSASITGPYVDSSGVSMANGGGTVILANNTSARYRGPGSCSILHNTDGQYYIAYHAYDSRSNGLATLRIAPLAWSNGWPTTVSSV